VTAELAASSSVSPYNLTLRYACTALTRCLHWSLLFVTSAHWFWRQTCKEAQVLSCWLEMVVLVAEYYLFHCCNLFSNLQGGPTKVKPTTILLVTFECIGKIQW